jgi:protein TonB
VETLNTGLSRFFALSLAVHILTFFVIKQPAFPRFDPSPVIPVSLLPQPAEKESSPDQRPAKPARAAPPARIARTPNAPTVVARKASDPQKAFAAPSAEKPAPAERIREEPPTRDVIPDNTVIAERQLPTLKDLLPSATYSSSDGRGNGSVSLNTKDPIFVTYFTKLKQSIEQQWEYPEMALRYGLQGTLALEFTIGSSGQLEQLRVIRSSGSELLDSEAIRAIRAAAPFPPIPSWVKPVPLRISASMEYHDNRLNYRFAR